MSDEHGYDIRPGKRRRLFVGRPPDVLIAGEIGKHVYIIKPHLGIVPSIEGVNVLEVTELIAHAVVGDCPIPYLDLRSRR